MTQTDFEGGVFATAQPRYAAINIPVFPVGSDKRPLVKHFQKFGIRGSTELINKFADAPAIGFMCGRRITSLDVDTTDERVLADAIDRHGSTPLVMRTASGKFQAFYKANGERRRIRPWPGLPIDLLGRGGFTIAPPSLVNRGTYQFIQGTLDDVDRLPVMRGLSPADYVESDDLCVPSDDFRPLDDVLPPAKAPATPGNRNKELYQACMRAAHSCSTLDMLIEIARRFNAENCTPPLPDEEVMRVAASAWDYEQSGTNRFGQHGAFLTTTMVRELRDNPFLCTLINVLLAENMPGATFMITNTFAETLGWPLRKLQAARRAAIEQGYLVRVSKPRLGKAAFYRFGRALNDKVQSDNDSISRMTTFGCRRGRKKKRARCLLRIP